MAGKVEDEPPAICGDASRLAAFVPYDILDTPREADYDDLARLAAQLCAAPIALISFVLADRQWFKAELGLGVRETALDSSICRHLLLAPGLTVIPDTRADARLADNPLVNDEPGLRFYAGCLLTSREGTPLGTLCVLDRQPRPGLEAAQRFALETMARQVMTHLELRRTIREQRALLAQKELLFEELNHRVKNSLQLIAALIQLQSAGSGDACVREQLAQARRRVLTVAELHSHLYGATDVGEVDLGAYLRALLVKIGETTPAAVELRLESGSLPVPTDSAVPIALIVNELVTNAIKYARPNGEPIIVRVAIDAAGGGLAVTVADDGIGLPADFNPKASGKLGLRIVSGLLRQLGATLAWDNMGGARFRLQLPSPVARNAA